MNGFDIRIATERDFPALSRLWAEVFGDDEAFTGGFFRSVWTPGCCVAAFAGSELAAMGYCLTGPTAKGLHCGYIYAMATAPEQRGRGLAAKIGRVLIANAFDGGIDIVATLPAEDSLNAWYETRLGMAPLFKKGGAGVDFPENWRRFSEFCGEHDPTTPDTLLAVARPGIDTAPLRGLGWECTFD